MRLIAGLSALLVVLLFPPARAAVPPFPGGILDATGRTAYLGTPNGIDAIDLAHGDLLWRHRNAHLPLLVAGDRLYALALSSSHKFSLVAFDLANNAKRVFHADITSLPRWVVTAERPGHTFDCTWRRVRSTLYLDWQASASKEARVPKQASGQLRIDLETGAVEDSPAALLTPRPARGLRPQLEKLAIRWQGQTADQFVAVVLEDVPEDSQQTRPIRSAHRQQRLVLRVWEQRSGKEGKPRELIRGTQLVVLPGLGGQHLWIRDAVPYPDEPGRQELTARHHWSVVSVLDGQLVARVLHIPGTQVATIINRRAYCLATAPRLATLSRGGDLGKHAAVSRVQTLHAIDLDTGKVVWRRTVGEGPISKRRGR